MVSLEEAVALIKRGEVVAYPTETAFGLGALALNKNAIKKVYALKKRSFEKKLPIIVHSIKDVEGVSELGKFMSQNFHPGPINITVKHKLPWFGAFRISSAKIAFRLAKECGPITATSANISGSKTPFTSEEVKKQIQTPVIKSKLKKGKTSTVYDPENRRIIREGAVGKNEIHAVEIAFDALKQIKPGKEEIEKLNKVVEEIKSIIQKYHKDFVFGGSVAKGTAIKPIKDLDFFLLFENGNLEEKLPLLEEISKEFGKTKMEYAQHPYIQTEYKGFVVELVPAYNSDEVKSAADRSKWHVQWVSKLPEEVKNQIMVFKQFCRGIGVYGADLRVEGLSAYAMEVLVSKTGGFIKTLKEIQKWKWPVFEADPVDKSRNVLASLSRQKFDVLKRAIEIYLNKPSKKFFFPSKKPLPPKKFEELYFIELQKPEMPEDAVWGWAKRQARKIKNESKHIVEKWSVFVERDKVNVLMKIVEQKEHQIKGPPLEMKQHVEAFRRKHKKVWEQEGHIFAKEPLSKFEGTPLKEKYASLSENAKQWVSDFFYAPWEY